MGTFNKVGVIGQGFVGTAVREGLRHAFEVMTYDIKNPNMLWCYCFSPAIGGVTGGVRELVEWVDGPIFVCVPTPMKGDGSCDTGVVEDVIAELNEAAKGLDKVIMVILKSTVPPGTTERLNAAYPHVEVCFNPEFLREASPNEDFRNQDRIILGGVGAVLCAVEDVYAKAYPNVPIYMAKASVAEMVKYATNVFLATKVSLANEIRQGCVAMGISYARVVELATLDKRLGDSHWQVPGHQGLLGFGGSCFPKDLNALMAAFGEAGVDPKVMRAAWQKNLEVRPARDWERLVGRAIVEKKERGMSE